MGLPRTIVVLFSLVLALLAGCDAVEQTRAAADRQRLMNDLKEFGLAYHSFHDANAKAPSGWADLQTVGVTPDLQKKLETAGYKFVFGVKLSEMTGGTSNFVLAYPANAASEGGLVALGDGAVTPLTAAEFNERWTAQQPIMSAAASGGP